MYSEITIVYNDPYQPGYDFSGEDDAVLGVIECVNAVHIALLDAGYIVYLLPIKPPLEKVRYQLAKLRTNLVFNLFEGFFDYPESEIIFAEMLERKNLRYTGCPPLALRMALNKANAKAIMQQNGIPVPRYQLISSGNIDEFNLSYPCIVKPYNQDASHGISSESVVRNRFELEKQVMYILQRFESEAIVEEYLSGREFNVCVLGNKELTVLPASEIIYSLPPDKPKILTYEAKWIKGTEYFENTRVECPAKIDKRLRKQIEDIAIAVYRLFGCSGYARLDLRQDDYGNLYVLELNPNPDISPDTGAARQAYAAGISYSQLIDKIVEYAYERVAV